MGRVAAKKERLTVETTLCHNIEALKRLGEVAYTMKISDAKILLQHGDSIFASLYGSRCHRDDMMLMSSMSYQQIPNYMLAQKTVKKSLYLFFTKQVNYISGNLLEAIGEPLPHMKIAKNLYEHISGLS